MIKLFHQFYLKQRFFPNWVSILINPFFYPRLFLLHKIKKFAPELNGQILDFGCGAKPYESLFAHADQYIGIDIENESHDHKNEKIDVFYNGSEIPFENNYFDSVFTSEVLEHVPNLNQTVYEIARVLKKDGKLLLTIPFSFPEHEMPFDFRRLTVGGVKQILQDQGFEIIQAEKYGSYLKVVNQLIIMYIHDLIYGKNRFINLFLNFLFIFPIQLISLLLTPLCMQNRSLYFGSIVLARKK